MPENQASYDVQAFSSNEKKDVILTPHYIIASVDKEASQGIVESLQKGDESGHNNLRKSEIYKIDTITKVTASSTSEDLNIITNIKGQRSSETFPINDLNDREKFLSALYRYMGNGFDFKVEQYSRFKAMFKPLLVMIVTICIGGIFAWLAPDAQEDPAKSTVKLKVAIMREVLKYLGTTGVLIITGIILFFTLIVLIGRVKNPPIMTFIKKKRRS